MSEEQTTTLIQRKAQKGREAYAARAMSLPRALRLTAAKLADQMMGLPVGVLGVTRQITAAAKLVERLEKPWLTMLMDGPGEQAACVMIDPVLASGLVQQQTMGKVMAAPEGDDPRKPTDTDAALCAPFIEKLLSGAANLPEEEAERNLLRGYRFGVLAREPRHAQMALEANQYEVVELTLDLAAGTRTGAIWLILPEPAVEEPEQDEEIEGPIEGATGGLLVGNVMELHAELTVALTQLKLPLQQVSNWQVGEVLPLNLSNMAHALVLDANGAALSRGTLGQIDGQRALQVEQKRAKQHNQPRRRAADREELDLPDVTGRRAEDEPALDPTFGLEDDQDLGVPSMSDVDIFGDIDDLADLPELEEAEKAADAQMVKWEAEHATIEDDQHTGTEKQAGW
ncbi:MAG: FliM/FliN family flagellar motor C-terminal domain-containing protein [Sulfitobacter sp.]